MAELYGNDKIEIIRYVFDFYFERAMKIRFPLKIIIFALFYKLEKCYFHILNVYEKKKFHIFHVMHKFLKNKKENSTN